MNLTLRLLHTPLGDMAAAVTPAGALARLSFIASDEAARTAFAHAAACGGFDVRWQADAAADVATQIDAYFAGNRQTFNLRLQGQGSPFLRRVWQELQLIPYGETTTYGDIARRIGNPRAARAVGRANHQNPIALVVPCHRVIGASGALTGYAAGLAIKERLLAWERRPN